MFKSIFLLKFFKFTLDVGNDVRLYSNNTKMALFYGLGLIRIFIFSKQIQ
jgi:hypothetical protein